MSNPASNSVLTLSNIRFQRDERVILNSLNWQVQANQLAAVLGPNGCGKSTLLRIITGYLWPTAGSVQLLGHTLGEYPVSKLRQRIGLVEATTIYPFDDGMTALDVVCSGYFAALTLGYVSPTAEQWDHARHCLQQVALGDRAAQLYATLSTGQRIRCLIARALVRKPELVLFDEPTAGLDLPVREAVLATLQRLHQNPPHPAVVVVTHHLEELLPGTSNIFLMGSGGATVAIGDPQQVLTNEKMTAAYGCPIHVHQTQGRFYAHVDPQSWGELLG